jgi:DNA replication protein DnaC
MAEQAKRLEPESGTMPVPIGDDLAAIMRRAEPRWMPCDMCQQLTSGRRCFDCQRRVKRLWEAREMTLSAVPEGFRWATLDAPELLARIGDDASLLARATAAIHASRVLFLGKSGKGKTSLAIAMMRARVEAIAKPGVFILATDLATARARQSLGSESPEIAAARTAKLLVLDDLGTDMQTPTSAVSEIVFHRHAHQRPTWITTWLSEEQMIARYGDGFARRVMEGARIIECGHP